MIQVFSQNFKATGNNISPEKLHIDTLGLTEKYYKDSDGDVIGIDYFLDPEMVTIAIKETRTHTKVDSVITDTTIKLDWYSDDGTVGYTGTYYKHY